VEGGSEGWGGCASGVLVVWRLAWQSTKPGVHEARAAARVQTNGTLHITASCLALPRGDLHSYSWFALTRRTCATPWRERESRAWR